jgi:hypothetical protein
MRKLVVSDNDMIVSKSDMKCAGCPHPHKRCIPPGWSCVVKIQILDNLVIAPDSHGVAITFTIIVIGKTGGISTAIRANCDWMVSIPISIYGGTTGITAAAFEINAVAWKKGHTGNFFECFPGTVFTGSAILIVSAYTIYIVSSRIVCGLAGHPKYDEYQ